MANIIKLSRSQIAQIVGNDPEAIKAFEKLLGLTATYLETGLIDGIDIAAGSGTAGVAGLSASVQALADLLDRGATVPDLTALEALLKALEITRQPICLEALEARLQALEAAPAYTPELRRYAYGAFHDMTTQTAAAINTAYGVTFGAVNLANGVTIGSPASRVYVDRANIFDFQFSLQLNKSSASLGRVFIWARVNGTDVTNSATEVSLSGSNAAVVAAWNFVLDLRANDYFELMWSTDNVDCQIVAVAATAPVPGIPSAILTVTDNIRA